VRNLQTQYSLHYSLKEYDKAEFYVHEIIAAFSRSNSVDYRSLYGAYDELAEIHSLQGKQREEIEALKKKFEYYQKFRDQKVEENNQKAEIKFGLKEKEAELKKAKAHTLFLWIGGGAIILALIAAFWVRIQIVNLRYKNKEQQLQISKMELQQAEVEKQQMELETQRAKFDALNALLKVEDMDKLLEKLNMKIDDKEIKRLISAHNFKNEKTNSYEILMKQVHPLFYEKLQQQAEPNRLTELNLKYCTLIRLSKNNKDIANIMNVSLHSVKSTKQVIKEKLNLNKDESLEQYLKDISPPSSILY
jgi:DNA-binding CsgD family transcriptional regulator